MSLKTAVGDKRSKSETYSGTQTLDVRSSANPRRTRAAGSGERAIRARTRSYKKALKANVRGRILSWSNWGLLTRFLLQSDSPDDGSGWHPAHCWGEDAGQLVEYDVFEDRSGRHSAQNLKLIAVPRR